MSIRQGKYIIASGDGGSGGTGNPDELTITINESNQLQAVGTLDSNKKGVIYDWIGTTAEYTAQQIEALHPDWLCFITDDYGEGVILPDQAGHGGEYLSTDGKNIKWGTVDLSTKADKTELASKANDDAVVHKVGNETIGGIKTFQNSSADILNIQDTVVDVSDPALAFYNFITMLDKTGNVTGRIFNMKQNGQNMIGLQAWNNGQASALTLSSNGLMFAPVSPAAESNDTQIATTAWVKANGMPADADYVIEHKVNSDGSWYRKYKSGWLEQAIINKKGSGNTLVISFLRPFANTNYLILKQLHSSSDDPARYRWISTWDHTTTSFTTASFSSGESWYACGQGATEEVNSSENPDKPHYEIAP